MLNADFYQCSTSEAERPASEVLAPVVAKLFYAQVPKPPTPVPGGGVYTGSLHYNLAVIYMLCPMFYLVQNDVPLLCLSFFYESYRIVPPPPRTDVLSKILRPLRRPLGGGFQNFSL